MDHGGGRHGCRRDSRRAAAVSDQAPVARPWYKRRTALDAVHLYQWADRYGESYSACGEIIRGDYATERRGTTCLPCLRATDPVPNSSSTGSQQRRGDEVEV